MASYYAIQDAERELQAVRSDYLKQHGWRNTSSTPGSYWMWWRSFADVNARRLEDHQAFCKRIGQDRKHDPYPDEMLVDENTAIRMTWAEIDPARLEIDLED